MLVHPQGNDSEARGRSETGANGMDANAYNYAVFPPDDDVEAFAGFGSHRPVSVNAPDPELHRAGAR